MKTIIVLCLFCAVVSTLPLKVSETDRPEKDVSNDKTDNEINNELDSLDRNVPENHANEQSRAGIIDTLNPFKENPTQHVQPKENNGNTQGTNNNNPLQAVQNLFLNGSNPFEQLFSSQSGGNFLDNIKVFLVGTQGMVMPASAIFGGFQNIMQTLGNMGNSLQLPPLPPLPSI